MTPKSLLRHKLAVSTHGRAGQGRVPAPDPRRAAQTPKKVKRVVVCGGKVYYDLVEDAAEAGPRRRRHRPHRAAVSVPAPELAAELKRFANAKEVVWCQEEPQNQGAWYQIQHHLRACLQPGQVLDYTGRARSPAPAAGHLADHVAEQAALVADALVNPLRGEVTVE